MLRGCSASEQCDSTTNNAHRHSVPPQCLFFEHPEQTASTCPTRSGDPRPISPRPFRGMRFARLVDLLAKSRFKTGMLAREPHQCVMRICPDEGFGTMFGSPAIKPGPAAGLGSVDGSRSCLKPNLRSRCIWSTRPMGVPFSPGRSRRDASRSDAIHPPTSPCSTSTCRGFTRSCCTAKRVGPSTAWGATVSMWTGKAWTIVDSSRKHLSAGERGPHVSL